MNYFALFLSVLWTMSAAPSVGEAKSARQAFNGPDRTITWKPWHQSPQGEYRFRTGDRYLGREVWEHYLCFEQKRSSGKAIKLFMIHRHLAFTKMELDDYLATHRQKAKRIR